ncbi:cobyrinic acid a,c-diamide synthase [Roseateles aquatilis]|uniref:Cobyrinic acid a,c-diamide synthase n=1 Tax=Roseateles aquatilis TaxID=431061 RepID=A0A246JMY8_9BURK|nr:cobyrinate a,c-diamide synthase [Roseateles aquatilis]OWQ93863.1 cobyrinic acid a,c-diamide synthase [Roseateles aquatilis]
MLSCPALLISAPASGQGKTSVTAAIARSARRRGWRVRVFKTGPDYLDPMVLERASGHVVYQLDLFMGGLDHCRGLLAEAARDADLILVEGVMGLFDGKPSSADLAAAFDLPVLVVLDASAMAQTFAALATGMARFRTDIHVAGVVANRIGSDAHARMVGEGLPDELPLIAALKRDATLSLPERHLGLVQALELPGLDQQLDRWADAWDAAEASAPATGRLLQAGGTPETSDLPKARDTSKNADVSKTEGLSKGGGVTETGGRGPLFGSQGRNLAAGRQPKEGHGEKGPPGACLALGEGGEDGVGSRGTGTGNGDSRTDGILDRPLQGRRIAIAKDACFSFIYPANIDLLKQLGAEVLTFSPIHGEDLPTCDALWLPGGYPELHAEVLRAHPRLFNDLRAHLHADRPLLAECGGMLALLDLLTDGEGQAHPMAGLMPGQAALQPRLAALGLQSIDWPEGELRGHTFHYSTMSTPLAPIAAARNPNAGRAAEALYAQGSLRASYIHHYFPSNPYAVASFFGGTAAPRLQPISPTTP